MRAALPALKASSSSKQWLARQARDPFVRARAGEDSASTTAKTPKTYRARSSFKLDELARKHPAILSGRAVVDLGAAPGGWSQVAERAIRHRHGVVVAVDLLPIEPMPGVEVVTGDFFAPDVRSRVEQLLAAGDRYDRTTADVVLSDMMAAMSGNRVRDVQASLDLVEAATEFAHLVLRPADGDYYAGGSLVMKYFHHPDLVEFKKTQLDPCFAKVVTDKPKASRAESSEAYFVCLGYKGRAGGSV
ncbi:Ribosomal RNA large subunit methyltransferase E [Vanrija pseudolonga]|uniref:rRNA methyltransferase 2, mitochondrial n=1 Tax=Vanrija pseudolonga TaxID=143232 RepID=A0AAF0Y6C0_9TREE|nr:Ribosomal RNA large subunit methyltransferase E [Vanrija pseudolonga]